MRSQGNHSLGYFTHGHGLGKLSGSGVGTRTTPFGRVTVAGKAGESRILFFSDIATNVCQYQAILVQANAAVAVSTTLCEPSLAADPTQTGIWFADTTLTGSEGIVALKAPAASAIKLAFTADAIVFLAAT